MRKPELRTCQLSMRPLIIGTFVAFALAIFSYTAQGQTFTEDQKTAVERTVRDLLLKNPEIIVEALGALEAKNAAIKENRIQSTLINQAGDIFFQSDDPVGGNPKGDVNVVEFFDYRCGYCKKVHDTVFRLLKEDGNIRYVYKEFPILGPKSVFASKAALASRSQGKYAEFSDALMRNRGGFSENKVFNIAEKIGLNIGQLKSDLKKGEDAINSQLARNYQLAEALDINGTPGFVIGNTIIRGAVEFEMLKAAVTRVRELEKQNKDSMK